MLSSRTLSRFTLSIAALVLFVTGQTPSAAQDVNDSTVIVQAFTFEDEPLLYTNFRQIYEYEGMVEFPQPGGRYEKILAYYTLKCDPSTKSDGFACGEWDYSTWIKIWDDSTTHWEIGRFITPYGIQLDLGPEGTTWILDVTDYGPILNGTKRVTAGNSQELLDLKFVFIKGVPPRDPLTVTRLWQPGSPSYESIVNDESLAPIEVTLNPDAAMYRINTRPQGGNFNGPANTDNCAEFCDREHWLTIDGEEHFRWNVWKTCGLNPVYPQGGTWPIDRAGWCPGDFVVTQHHELTPYVVPGEKVTIDYGIENPPQFEPYGHWVFWADLVAYGPPNFTNDASLEAIVAPNDFTIYGRSNPICSSPIVRIKNTGGETLNSLTITYGFEGETPVTFEWAGELEFLEEADVVLPALPYEQFVGDDLRFTAAVSNPNGEADEYGPNNSKSSTVEVPPLYPPTFTVELKTNRQAAAQYEWEMLDADGTVIQRGDNLSDETLYTYPFDLPEGCYTFRLVNREGFGLDFFAVRDALGTGSLRFTSGPGTLKTFEPDFGSEIRHEFRVGAVPLLSLSSDTVQFGRVAPGTTSQKVLEISPANSAGLDVVRVLLLSSGTPFSIDSTSPGLSSGTVSLDEEVGPQVLKVYMSFKPTADREYSNRMIIQSNDVRSSAYTVQVRGTGDASLGVDDDGDYPDRALSLSVVPSTVNDRATVSYRIGRDRDHNASATLRLIDVRGKEVRTIATERAVAGDHTVSFDTEGLASGTYYVVLSLGSASVAEEIRVTR